MKSERFLSNKDAIFRLFHALPSIQHQLTYFFFISSTILLIVAFAGDKWLTGLVLVSNESVSKILH